MLPVIPGMESVALDFFETAGFAERILVTKDGVFIGGFAGASWRPRSIFPAAGYPCRRDLVGRIRHLGKTCIRSHGHLIGGAWPDGRDNQAYEGCLHRITYNSSDLIGGEQIQKEQWISSLTSGYARLRADPAIGKSFEGELRIVRTCDVSVGTIHGTVKSISRTPEDIAAQSTNNVVLLLNAGHSPLSVDQSGRSVELSPGASVLVEQSSPSIIRVSDGQCGLIAVQTDRERVRQRYAGFEDRLMTVASSTMMINALVRAYVGVLADEKEAVSTDHAVRGRSYCRSDRRHRFHCRTCNGARQRGRARSTCGADASDSD